MSETVSVLRAYHGDPELKEKFVAEMKRHKQLDMVAQCATGETTPAGWRGCHVACAVHSMAIINNDKISMPYDHELWPELLGMPVWMAHLCEHIFEELPLDAAADFTVAFSEAVACGKVLDELNLPLRLFVLERVSAVVSAMPQSVREFIEKVIKILRIQLANPQIDDAVLKALVNDATRLSAQYLSDDTDAFALIQAGTYALQDHERAPANPADVAAFMMHSQLLPNLPFELRDELLRLVA